MEHVIGDADPMVAGAFQLSEARLLPSTTWRAASDLERALARLDEVARREGQDLHLRLRLLRHLGSQSEGGPLQLLSGIPEPGTPHRVLERWWAMPDPARGAEGVVEAWIAHSSEDFWGSAVGPGSSTEVAVREAAVDLMKWVAGRDRVFPPGLAAVALQGQVRLVEPFATADGGQGWMLAAAIVATEGLLSDPLLFPEIERGGSTLLARPELELTRDLRLATAAALELKQGLERLRAYSEEVASRLEDSKVSGAAAEIGKRIPARPVRNAGEVAEELGITHQGAMNALRRLKKIGLVTEERRSGKLWFYASELIDALGYGP